MNFYLLLLVLICLISVTWAQDEEQTEPTSYDELIGTEENTEHVTHELESVTEPHVNDPELNVDEPKSTSVTENSNEHFAKHKRKEKFCAAKMVECLTDASDPGPEADMLNNLEPQKGIAALLQAISSMNPGSVNSFRCNMQNFVGLQRCCSSSPHQLFKGAVVFACSEGQSVVPRSALEDYVLNVGQHDDATINLTSTDTYAGSMLGNAVCFMDCIFRKRFLISEEGAIILPSVRSHIMRAVGQVWTIAALEALANCSALVPGVHPEPIMRKSHRTEDVCLVQPFLLVQCLRHRMLLSCPKPSKRLQSFDCENKLERLKKCDVFVNKII